MQIIHHPFSRSKLFDKFNRFKHVRHVLDTRELCRRISDPALFGTRGAHTPISCFSENLGDRTLRFQENGAKIRPMGLVVLPILC